jgi:diguanylate cyclase
VRRDATTDGLTNLANRKTFDDTWGHQTGYQVIRFVATVIGGLGSFPRFSARYGGEEFAMIFPSDSAEVIEAALEEIRVEVASRMLRRRSTNEYLGRITISSGFAERHPGETALNVIDRADTAR